MTVAVAIFAKTLGLSRVKTRLAADTGLAKAEIFYQLSVRATAEMVETLQAQSTIPIHAYWALAEEEGLDHPDWQGKKTIWTGDGGLGTRQHHIYSRLRQEHNFVVLIGTDSPHRQAYHITHAVKTLHQNSRKCVITPAADGGYTLFAAGVSIPKHVWCETPYSQANTKAQLRAALHKENLDIIELREDFDIDTRDDLYRLYRELCAMPVLLPAQKELLGWLSDTILGENTLLSEGGLS